MVGKRLRLKINGNASDDVGSVTFSLKMVLTVIFYFGMAYSVLYLQKNFVSKAAYDADTKEQLRATLQIARDSQRITDGLEQYRAIADEIKARQDKLEERVRQHAENATLHSHK